MRKNRKGRRVAPGIWKLNQETFFVQAQPIDPQTGKRRNLRRTISKATLNDAVALRAELMSSAEPPMPAVPSWMPGWPTAQMGAMGAPFYSMPSTSRETVESFGERWLVRKVERGDLSDSTAERYAYVLDHLSHRLRTTPMVAVRPEDIERWMLASMKQYHPGTINSWRRVLRALFNDAKHQLGIFLNPVEATRPLVEPIDLEEPNALPPEEVVRVLEQVRTGDPNLARAIWTQALTGMRLGEVTALAWPDFDEVRLVLTIRRKVVKGRLVPSTKTGRMRRVGVSAPLLRVLEEQRAWLEADEVPGRESGLMFPSSKGTPLANSRFSEAMRDACRGAGIAQRFTTHGLRRSMTDALRLAGVDPAVAKSMIGHSTDRMREHYSTVSRDEVRAAAEAVALLLFPSAAE